MTQFTLGWEEWLALPDLGLPAIRAKVDTGARTSALHAFAIEPFGSEDKPMVRFAIHPDPADPGLEIICSAPLKDRRDRAALRDRDHGGDERAQLAHRGDADRSRLDGLSHAARPLGAR